MQNFPIKPDHIKRIAAKAAKKHTIPGSRLFDEMIESAFEVAAVAVSKFDESKGTFNTCLYWTCMWKFKEMAKRSPKEVLESDGEVESFDEIFGTSNTDISLMETLDGLRDLSQDAQDIVAFILSDPEGIAKHVDCETNTEKRELSLRSVLKYMTNELGMGRRQSQRAFNELKKYFATA